MEMLISKEVAESTQLLGRADPDYVALQRCILPLWKEHRHAGCVCSGFGGPDLEKECESREGLSASFLSLARRRRMPGCSSCCWGSQLRPPQPAPAALAGAQPVQKGALPLHNLMREAQLAPSSR